MGGTSSVAPRLFSLMAKKPSISEVATERKARLVQHAQNPSDAFGVGMMPSQGRQGGWGTEFDEPIHGGGMGLPPTIERAFIPGHEGLGTFPTSKMSDREAAARKRAEAWPQELHDLIDRLAAQAELPLDSQGESE